MLSLNPTAAPARHFCTSFCTAKGLKYPARATAAGESSSSTYSGAPGPKKLSLSGDRYGCFTRFAIAGGR